ncbi:MAG TPA: 30S ribosomal protein S19 [Candidatus Nanoarchaeia archaeon]|nr:30S ribosomal protein S19 [Candidatus Nanoarchaeia archaeon]
MAKKEFAYRGKTLEEIKSMNFNEFIQLLPSARRRSLKRGFTEQQKRFIEKVRMNKNNIETHCRDLVVLPEMVGRIIKVHNGKEFVPVHILPEMIGHLLGEFALTRRKVSHSAPGIGATRSSAAISVR